MSTLIENGPPRLVCVDTGLQMVGLWLPNSGALRLWVGEVRRTAMCLSAVVIEASVGAIEIVTVRVRKV